MDITLDEWVNKIGNKPVPVMKQSIEELKYHCARENAPVSELVESVERDPGLVVHLLRTMNGKSKSSLSTDVTSVQQALMLMGTDQLSALPNNLPALEKCLEGAALDRLLKTFSRAYHAARQATAWARLRRDMTPDEIFAATQLHFLGEMYIAMYAPELLDNVDNMRNEKNIASEEAQYVVLGFTLDQLTAKLARLWKLPQLILEALHPENAKYPRAYGIMLAVQLARGTAVCWYSDKTRNIQEQVAEWLKLDSDKIIAGTHQLAAEVAREAMIYKVTPAAYLLASIPVAEEKSTANQPAEETARNADICLVPQLNVLKVLLGYLRQSEFPHISAYQLISNILKGMHDGIGLNRVLFASYSETHTSLRAEKIIGADTDPRFSRFEISLKLPSLFSRLMEKTQAILINDQNRVKFWSLVPEDFQKLIGTNSFIAMSVIINNKPVGLFYADRHHSSCQVDERSYNFFKTVCNHASQAMQKLPRLDFNPDLEQEK
ncbi:HDOD domain-containing protein [Kaarinaea lacus]